MKTSELRIGNLVRCNDYSSMPKKEWECREIFTDGVNIVGQKFLDIYLEAIPLTEEWLLKFGFDKKTRSFVKCKISIKCQSKFFYYIPTSLEIKYVHQLQNLYFVLTNEELTFKLE